MNRDNNGFGFKFNAFSKTATGFLSGLGSSILQHRVRVQVWIVQKIRF